MLFSRISLLTITFNKVKRKFFNLTQSSSDRKTYSEKRILNYSKDELFTVVSRVEDYQYFLPACTKSIVTHREENFIKAELQIGFPPMIIEQYTSHVSLDRPNFVRAQCFDGKLFKHLITEWKFEDGKEGDPNTCVLNFFIDFEFRSKLYRNLADKFFDQAVHQTINAFLRRSKQLYGR